MREKIFNKIQTYLGEDFDASLFYIKGFLNDDIDYSFDESLKDSFMSSITKYWPDIDSKKLQPDYVGIRPKLQDIDEKMKDFSICDSKVHGVEGLINIQGIESPGVTSSLAIGEYVKNMINLKDDPLTYL